MKWKETCSFFISRGHHAVLLLHSFAGNPSQMSYLATQLAGEGYSVYCPTFDGHGKHPLEILSYTPDQWLENARQAYAFLEGKGFRTISIIGLSLGGSIALRLGPIDKGIVVIGLCVPISIRMDSDHFLDEMKRQIRFYERDTKHFITNTPWNQDEIKAFLENVSHFLTETLHQVHSIENPIYLLQARQDEWIDPEETQRLFQQIKSREKDLIYFENSKHLITIGNEREKLATMIKQILQNHIHKK